MKTYRPMLKFLGPLFAVAAWAAGARAADMPAPKTEAPPPNKAVGVSKNVPAEGPGKPSGRLVPEQFSTLFKIADDNNPEGSVPTVKDRNTNPLEFGYYLQDLLTRAEVETKRKDYPRVIKYYRALAAAIPEEAQGWSLLCEAYQTAGDRERALRACKYAIDRKGVQIKDYRRYVELLVAKPDALDADERTEINAVLGHLDQQPDAAVPTAHIRCEAAVKMNDAKALQACTSVLGTVAPDDRKTIVFQWSLAVLQGDPKEAAQLLARAEKAGVAPESLDRMSKVAITSHWWVSPGRGVAMLGVAVLLALLAMVAYRRRLTTGRRLAP